MIRSYGPGGRRALQDKSAVDHPERQDLPPSPRRAQLIQQALPAALPAQFPSLQVCPRHLARALMEEETHQTLKLVARLRWASGATRP